MDLVLSRLVEFFPFYGPWILFLLAILETCFLTGLVVPAGVALSVATVLAVQGNMALAPLVLASAVGGALGDTIGFWVGRSWGRRAISGEGRFARELRARHARASALLSRHPVYSVTGARLVSFVRTLMPMAAGMSDLEYRRYLPYQMVGLAGWVAGYVAIGLLARESWEIVTRVVGVAGGTIFVLVGVMAWLLRWRSSRRPIGESGGGQEPC